MESLISGPGSTEHHLTVGGSFVLHYSTAHFVSSTIANRLDPRAIIRTDVTFSNKASNNHSKAVNTMF